MHKLCVMCRRCHASSAATGQSHHSSSNKPLGNGLHPASGSCRCCRASVMAILCVCWECAAAATHSCAACCTSECRHAGQGQQHLSLQCHLQCAHAVPPVFTSRQGVGSSCTPVNMYVHTPTCAGLNGINTTITSTVMLLL